jgi:formate dehydrogenase major subunit
LNEGWLCAKGRFGYGFIHSPDRLKKPLIRTAPKDISAFTIHQTNPPSLQPQAFSLQPLASFKEVSWDEAFDYIANRLKQIKENYGPDAIAGLSSARCTSEENYLFQKFFRAVIGTNNIDHCARY